jgi:hypothetical protein
VVTSDTLVAVGALVTTTGVLTESLAPPMPRTTSGAAPPPSLIRTGAIRTFVLAKALNGAGNAAAPGPSTTVLARLACTRQPHMFDMRASPAPAPEKWRSSW